MSSILFVLHKGFKKPLIKMQLCLSNWYNQLPWQKQHKGRFWEGASIDAWRLPVYRWRLWVPWFLHLGVQGLHCLSLPGALWPGAQGHRATVRRVVGGDPGVHRIRVAAKRPVKLLDLGIVTLPSLSLPKFSSFRLDPGKLREGWNQWMFLPPAAFESSSQQTL